MVVSRRFGGGRTKSGNSGQLSLYISGDVISCEKEVESEVRDKLSCAWSKWRELASLLLNHDCIKAAEQGAGERSHPSPRLLRYRKIFFTKFADFSS